MKIALLASIVTAGTTTTVVAFGPTATVAPLLLVSQPATAPSVLASTADANANAAEEAFAEEDEEYDDDATAVEESGPSTTTATATTAYEGPDRKKVAPFADFDADVYTGPNLAYAGEPGVVAPLGLFDPFSLLDGADRDRFDRLRSVELKHGRASMLAVVGYLTTYAGVRLPGLEDVPGGLEALNHLPDDVVGQFGMTLLVMEIANRDQTGLSEFPGDFRNGVIDFGWDDQTPEWKLRKRNTELQNGRAAMMGILALMVHEGLGNVDELIPTQLLS